MQVCLIMMLSKLIIFIFFNLLFSVSCSDREKVTVGLADRGAEKITIEKLKSENIWYESEKDGRYTFLASDIDQIIEIHKNSTEQIIPSGRSISYGDELHEIVIRKLEAEDIPYTVRKYDGSDWIIWEQSDDIKFKKATKEVEDEFYEKLKSKLINEKNHL